MASGSSSHAAWWLGVSFAVCFGTSASDIRAQHVDASALGLRSAPAAAVVPVPAADPARSVNPLKPAIASAVVPGWGQMMLKQRRGLAYLAIETAALAFYISQTRDGRRQRDRYRQISRDVARSAFNPDGPRGNWDYYERMEKFISSGDYDEVTGGGVDPETDEETYNGSMWLLARRTYWRDPEVPPAPGSVEYESALSFYERRAVPHDMRWSWVGATASYQDFRAAIAGSNSAFRNAGHTASIILANHFLSAVDAYVSAQVRLRRNEDGSVSGVVSVPFRY